MNSKKKIFIFLAVAGIVFGHKILPAKSAEDICNCTLEFQIADAEPSTGFCKESIKLDYDGAFTDSTFIANQIFEKCAETNHVPETSGAGIVVDQSFERAQACEDDYNDTAGSYSYTLQCSRISGAVTTDPVEGGASAGKSAGDLQTDAAIRLNPAKISNPAQLIGRFIQILLAFIGSISLVLYIYAGILWMTASGASERVDTAKKILVWTTLGVVVMLASYMLTSFVFKSLGL